MGRVPHKTELWNKNRAASYSFLKAKELIREFFAFLHNTRQKISMQFCGWIEMNSVVPVIPHHCEISLKIL